MREYNADPLGFTANISREYGDIVPLRFGPVRAVMLSDPAAIESVLVEHHSSFRKARGVRRLRTLLGNGIVLSEGDYWLRHRRLMQPAFHRASVGRYAEAMVRRTSAALDRWAAADVVDVVPEARRLTLEIAVETLFGNEVSQGEAREIGAALEIAGAQLQTRVSSLLMFVPDWLPTLGNRRMNAAIARIDRLVYRIIGERHHAPADRQDLLALLLAQSDADGGGLTDRELRDEVITLLVAGHETTALTLSWALYELARHPEADAALDSELARVLGGDRLPDLDDVSNLRVTANIVAETLRLFPAGYVTAREAKVDIDVRGYPIKKGTLVLMSQWEQQRDPQAFDEPEVFKPERWDGTSDKHLARGDYFPFGMGPRQCMGMAFANLELVLALATIRRRYRLEPTSHDEARPVPIVALNPDRPIRLRLIRS